MARINYLLHRKYITVNKRQPKSAKLRHATSKGRETVYTRLHPDGDPWIPHMFLACKMPDVSCKFTKSLSSTQKSNFPHLTVDTEIRVHEIYTIRPKLCNIYIDEIFLKVKHRTRQCSELYAVFQYITDFAGFLYAITGPRNSKIILLNIYSSGRHNLCPWSNRWNHSCAVVHTITGW